MFGLRRVNIPHNHVICAPMLGCQPMVVGALKVLQQLLSVLSQVLLLPFPQSSQNLKKTHSY